MRGLGVFKDVAWAESADSTNVARNHCRLRESHGEDRVRELARRIEAPIQLAAMELDRKVA
jgi:transcription elongation GreA/GreB family factor